ncbi:MAG: hypothetical protein RIG84_19545 [Roseovarius sp.]
MAAVVGAVIFARSAPVAPDLRAAYATPARAPGEGRLGVFHLGHSLVGRDMPAMLAQLAGEGHRYDSQLGWGTSLKEHWEPDVPINGFEAENDHPRFRPAREAVASGDYDAVVLTEMVELRDAIRYHASGKYFARWAALAREADPEAQIYLYETWHHLDDEEGWLERLDRDLERYWIEKVLARDAKRNRPAQPVYIIPAGQVMAEFARELEARGGVDGLSSHEGLFQRNADGTLDTIHLNDLGTYLVALTHYAVLYHRSPVGLPHRLLRADGTPADAPSPELARLMQQTVWQVVTRRPETGVAG